MTINEIYNLAIKMGVEADFRGKDEIERKLKRLRDKYDKLEEKDKEVFDKERLKNPYSDTRILFGQPEKEVKKVLVGIDIGGEELFLADKMGDIDLVISHHPRGIALAGLDDVMELQIDLLYHYGVPENIAEKLIVKRIEEVGRGLSPGNHNRVVDIASHLNTALMCVHTPSDNLVARFLEKKIEEAKPRLVEDVMKIIEEIPEYKKAAKIGLGPKIFVGAKENRVGKVVLTEITGGTEGSPKIYEKMSQAGIGTVISMHQSEEHRKEAEAAHINVVVAGHMSSDSLGMNIFLDELKKQGIEIVSCSGFLRVSHMS